MNIVLARSLAKMCFLLYKLKLISYSSYDKKIDKLTVLSLKHSMESKDGGSNSNIE